ncbi:MAG: hypothetical protein LBU08_01485 [Tannerellaceae bacterium]|jgi:hypothetical protein|nr:hypothetical protein [Tannerellaceae bacterium]
MRKRGKQHNFFKVFVSSFGMVLLLFALAPHFHHADDGQICTASGHTENAASGHTENTDGERHEGCMGAGHTVAFPQRETLSESLPAVAVLPLLSLYALNVDYALTAGKGTAVISNDILYVETLHSCWASASSGLRAPPVFC